MSLSPTVTVAKLTQAAWKKYCDAMDVYWKQVLAGEITEQWYWKNSRYGPEYAECQREIDEAWDWYQEVLAVSSVG